MSATRAARITWDRRTPPKCWDNPDSWPEWLLARSGARAPCVDCEPEYQERMMSAGRCTRPETVFVDDYTSMEVVGICADDPAYARVLRGESLGKNVQRLGRWVEFTDLWKTLLSMAQSRACMEVKLAIEQWMRTFRRMEAAA